MPNMTKSEVDKLMDVLERKGVKFTEAERIEVNA